MSDVMAHLRRAAQVSKMESERQRATSGMTPEMRPLILTEQERAWAPLLGQRQPGKCYEQATVFITDNYHELARGATFLVHGVLWRTGISHGWVELPGFVLFDGMAQMYFDQGDYYRALDAEAERRYPAQEALQMTVETGTYGPWHDAKGRGIGPQP